VSAPRIWLAEFDEAESVAALLVEFRNWYGRDWPSDNAFLASVERLLEDGRQTEFLLGAPHDDAPPSGVAQLRYRYSVWTAADDCWLEDLWVREDARRVGLGAALVEGACRRAAERGCRRIELDVSEANAGAIALYENLGFSTGKLPGGRDLFMQRRLG
jgi:ribosomal protein S18 acetylase RimI-like enzyme